jgi:hypothetical protein
MIKTVVFMLTLAPLKPLNSSDEHQQTYLQLPYQYDDNKEKGNISHHQPPRPSAALGRYPTAPGFAPRVEGVRRRVSAEGCAGGQLSGCDCCLVRQLAVRPVPPHCPVAVAALQPERLCGPRTCLGAVTLFA